MLQEINNIKLLSAYEVQKIAAGEVVERPASVLKELLENAIDAGARTIAVSIEQAGKKLIRVIDDGYGMTPENAKRAPLLHATSKISCLADIENISSFGFRGEALAAIVAISKVTIITRTPSLSTGIQLTYVDGKLHNEREMACNSGTDISVSNLFYNTPARQKFLKRNETEWHRMLQLTHAFCLAHRSIHFRLFHNSKLVMHAPPTTTLLDRIRQVWDSNFAEQCLTLAPTKNKGFSIEGCISHHQFWRYNRQLIYCFVNNRLVKNQELSRGLLQGYQNVLPEGKFPAAFLFITIDGNLLDINVHPRKEEIKFSQPLLVQRTIKMQVKNSLQQHISTQLSTPKAGGEVSFDFDSPPLQSQHMPTEHSKTSTPLSFQPAHTSDEFKQRIPHLSVLTGAANSVNSLQPHPHTQAQQPNASLPQSQELTIIGQLFATYILLQNNNSFIIVDQHAAHERILYEQLRNRFEKREGIILLFPLRMTLNARHLTFIATYKELFANHGIEIEEFSNNEIVIKTCPALLQNHSLTELVKETLDVIEEHHHLDQENLRKKLHEHMHSQLACKTAIKAGDLLAEKEIRQLINDLNQTENRYICVHGRPTMWTIPKHQLEKQFKRRR